MTKPTPWTKFAELLEALAVEGALNQTATADALEKFADSFLEDVDRDMYRGELSIGLGRQGNFSKAAQIIAKMENPQERAEYWRRLAEQQFQSDRRDDAQESLRRSEEAINSLAPNRNWERAEILSRSAKLLDDFELREEALTMWNKATNVARIGQTAGSDSSDCSAVLTTIAKQLAEGGRLELAKSVANSITIPGRRQLAHELIEKAAFLK
jgi:tetratricopeptide (TPR) repeat protein